MDKINYSADNSTGEDVENTSVLATLRNHKSNYVPADHMIMLDLIKTTDMLKPPSNHQVWQTIHSKLHRNIEQSKINPYYIHWNKVINVLKNARSKTKLVFTKLVLFKK